MTDADNANDRFCESIVSYLPVTSGTDISVPVPLLAPGDTLIDLGSIFAGETGCRYQGTIDNTPGVFFCDSFIKYEFPGVAPVQCEGASANNGSAAPFAFKCPGGPFDNDQEWLAQYTTQCTWNVKGWVVIPDFGS